MAYTVGTPVGNQVGGLTTITVAPTLLAGDGCLVFVNFDNVTATISSCTDTGGNTYTVLQTRGRAPSWAGALIYAPNCAAGTPTISVVLSAAAGSEYWAFAIPISGLGTGAAQTSIAADAGETTATDGTTTGNMTPSSQPAGLFGVFLDAQNNVATAAGTGFTSIVDISGLVRIEHMRITSTSPVAATFTEASSSRGVAFGVVLTEAGGGGASTPKMMMTLGVG